MLLQYSTAFVTLTDSDGNTLIPFYTQLLNKAPERHIPGAYAEFELPGLRLAIFRPQASHQSEFAAKSSGGMSLCLEVENLEEAIAHFTALGHAPPGEITVADHGREIYAYDPAGNRLILHQK